ncbi:MAG TPA: NAD(P)-dependent alcohol dehydrogenase, partial [Mizugakiibacter sp.]
ALGQRVGIGWNASSCMHCAQCVAGDAHLCADGGETIVGRHGGFAERARCQWTWATPLPEGIDVAIAGPLFCAGVTVFSPLVEFGVRPTDRVAVAGIGGLGHLALQFLRAWGCEVTALSSTAAKRAEARALGAHHAVDSRSREALRALYGAFDFVLVTVNVPLDWHALLKTLAPRGRLHFVGSVLEPFALSVPRLSDGQLQVSGSPTGRPATVATMLQFCARHGIAPRVERFPMAQTNKALAHLREGRAHYRVVLDADFA